MLRDLNESDLELVMDMMSDPIVNEYFYGFQRDRDIVELSSYTLDYFFSPFSKTQAKYGIGGIAIHELDPSSSNMGKFMGITGYFPPPSHHQEFGPELIYILRSEFHGKGYAYEAANAAIEYAQTETDIEWLSLTTDAPNIGSRNVAEKLGFSEFGPVAAYGAEDMVFYTKKLR